MARLYSEAITHTVLATDLTHPIIRFLYFGSTFAITEIDGVRIIGPDVCDLIQKVPGTRKSNADDVSSPP